MRSSAIVPATLCCLMLPASACTRDRRADDDLRLTPQQEGRKERQAPAEADAGRRFEASKSRYVARTEAAIADLETKIAAHRAAAPAAPLERELYMNEVAALEQNLADTKAKLDQVRAARLQSWTQVQRELEQSLLTTRAAYDAAAATAH